ncbi:hypothetical protein WDU94_008786, partial [Cyamophila willieti]
MIYDDVNKKWMPSGSSSGLSKVHVFQHQVNNTFRVVGRKLQNQEVVINCVILKSLKYNQATATFHQWRDNKQVYGLNFSSKEDADAFAGAMLFAVEVLASAPRPNIQQFPSPPVYPQTNGQYEEDMGYRPIIPIQQPAVIPPVNQTNLVYSEHNITHNHSVNNNMHSQLPPSHQHQQDRTMTREDVAVLQERRMSQQSQISSPSAVSPPAAPPQPPAPPGHHRASSAPPPPLSLATPPAAPAPPPAPPAPAMPPAISSGPPCPPPPPMPFSSSGAATLPRSSSSDLNNQPSPSPSTMDMGSLAAQLQSARLKRANKQSAENSGSSTTSSSSGGAGGYSTLGRGNTGMASMMDEMAKTLARRRAAVEKKEPDTISNQELEGGGSVERRAGSVGSVTWNNNNSKTTPG